MGCRALLSLTLCYIGLLVFLISMSGVAPSLGTEISKGMPKAPEQINGSTLIGVACVSAFDCWAVGYHGPDNDRTLIEHWDGSAWLVVPSANSSTNSWDELYSVACNSSSDCWAVGQKSEFNVGVLVEHWDGASWSIVDAPGAQGAYLSDVTCLSATDCWAVGIYYDASAGREQTLVEHWNGISWQIVASPNSTGGNALNGIACASSSDCWVVGYYDRQNGGRPLLEHWNGALWSIISGPNAMVGSGFGGVICASTSECWAVGGTSDSRSLIMQWNGNTWSEVATPNVGLSLRRVACPSASDCWTISPLMAARIQHWNGTSWDLVPAPGASEPYADRLHDISCISAADCWAVGEEGNDRHEPLVVHWDGNSWSKVPTPRPLIATVSRMIHGSAGSFDVDLVETECRSGGTNGEYQIIFTFQNPLINIASVDTTYGSIASHSIGPDPNQYTVNLAGMPNVRDVRVALYTVEDTTGNLGNFSAVMQVLIGDANSNRLVNASDAVQVKSQIGESIDATNFRLDLNASGSIDATDLALAKSKIGTGLP